MAAIYKLAPEFLYENRLYWLRSPLYIEKIGKKENYFFTDEELSHASIKGELQRNKGLGSLSPDQARASMFDSANQRLEPMEPDEEAIELLVKLMSENNDYRKEFIFNNVDFSTIRE